MTDRQDIVDVLVRYATGIDGRDTAARGPHRLSVRIPWHACANGARHRMPIVAQRAQPPVMRSTWARKCVNTASGASSCGQCPMSSASITTSGSGITSA